MTCLCHFLFEIRLFNRSEYSIRRLVTFLSVIEYDISVKSCLRDIFNDTAFIVKTQIASFYIIDLYCLVYFSILFSN